MSVLCPVDAKDDAIQSVTALVAEGKASGSFSGSSGGMVYVDGKFGYSSGTATLYGSLTSDLARQLARPEPPKPVGFWALWGWSFLFFLSISIIVGPFLVWGSFKKSMVSDPDERRRVFTPGFSAGCVCALFFGWIPEILFLPIFPMKKALNDRLNIQNRVRLWQEACARWERLFYCHRCGIVFDPASQARFTPSQISEYLHTNEFRR